MTRTPPYLLPIFAVLFGPPGWDVHPVDGGLMRNPGPDSLRVLPDTTPLGERRCRSCTISLSTIAQIRGSDLDPDITVLPYASLAVGKEGVILLGSVQAGGSILEFLSDGRLRRSFAPRRDGLGAVRSVSQIIAGPGDTVYVLDAISRRLHRLTADGDYIDDVLLPGGVANILPLGGTRLFVSASIPTRRSIGRPLHVLDTLGVVASFGDEASVVVPGDDATLLRHLAAGTGDTVWVAHHLSYHIEAWSHAGRLVRVFTRDVPWFPGDDPAPREAPQTAPRRPAIHGIYDDGSGHLWVYITRAAERWSAAPLQPTPIPGMFAANPVLDRFLDTIIEVIDLAQQAVVATHRDDRALFPIAGGYLVSYQEDDEGQSIYTVLRPQLDDYHSYHHHPEDDR